MSPFVILGVSGLFCHFYSILMEILLANVIDPDQTPHHVASDLGLHCLLMTLYGFPDKNEFKRSKADDKMYDCREFKKKETGSSRIK